MLFPMLVMGSLAVVLVLVGFLRGYGEHVAGLRMAALMTIEVLPLLLFALRLCGGRYGPGPDPQYPVNQ